ncbi:MAG: RnfABCDGE type electron transport complex subunit B [Gammaproteobacteria bacterium]
MRADADRIHALLPQTQCTRCGYQGCRPYAEAVAAGEALINRCPPGGAATIDRLAALLQLDPLPLDETCGSEGPPTVAVIDESTCIGCARCLPPCPVDAIVGAQRQMHTVINDLCTGCELCIAPCPVDCIRMVPRASLHPRSAEPTAERNLDRFESHETRRLQRETERRRLLDERKQRVCRPGV